MDRPYQYNVAVFDVDGTLVKGDTFLTFAYHSLGVKALFASIAATLPWLLGWEMGLVSNGTAKEKLFSRLYKNKLQSEIKTKAETFRAKFSPGILERLRAHLDAGDKVYLITASVDMWIDSLAKSLGVTALCTQAETEHGIYTGRFKTPNCYGREKARRLLKAEPNKASYHLTVYGDSKGDEALFAMADRVIDLRCRQNSFLK